MNKEACCDYYQKGLDKLNAIITLQSVRAGSNTYDGKPFVFCPWCGEKTEITDETIKQETSNMPPTPSQVLDKANKLPTPKPYIPLEEYGQAMQVLRDEKSMTFSEIRDWLELIGLDYTTAHVNRAYRDWQKINPNKLVD